MFQEILISPILFVEAVFGCLVLPKITSVDPVYSSSVSGGVLTGLSTIGIMPQIHSFWPRIAILATMFVLFCLQTLVDHHNARKTISLWTNCFGMSCYGAISGLSLSLVSGYAFVQYVASILVSTLSISYSLGNRYIEYVSNSNDRLPLILFSLSTPVGLVVGRYSGLSFFSDSELLLAISAGTFLTFGIQSLLSHSKLISDLYIVPDDSHRPNSFLVCFSVLLGLSLSGFLQSSFFVSPSLLISGNYSHCLNCTNSSSL